MIPTNSPSTQIDQDSERRRALAKVYDLLIKLAEEADNQKTLPDTVIAEEGSISEPTPEQLVLL